jgi:alkanesulfonate monooxygenase SsuD/methylene tetrahydromethanopterin reductase-like flavin-dependent oxidoreductase (luciferase family)
MGGRAGKIYERIAKHGDGWFIPGAGADDLPPMLAELRAACTAEGRNYDDIELTTMWNPKGGEDSLKVLADLGIDRVVTILGGDLDAIKALAETHIK